MTSRRTPIEDITVASIEANGRLSEELQHRVKRERNVLNMRLLWQERRFLRRAFCLGLIVSFVIAFLIPSQYASQAKLMPPDKQSGLGLGMLAALMGKGSGGGVGAGIGGDIGDLLGGKTTGDLFVGVLESRTVQDDLIAKFNLRHVYWDRDWESARKDLTGKTDITTDRKSGILTVTVTDRVATRAAAMATEYIDQLNLVMSRMDTSEAHREREFLEGRLGQVRQDLETAEKNFGEFASKNVALDVPAQGKAMVEATASLEGELIAAQTELQGLKQIYTDNNIRIRSIQARINELRSQLKKMGGKAALTADAEVPDAESIYPSIRRLPLLGVAYADLLRRAKIQEAIFETLTQEYEIAKVQEAKELPSVKVLDPPDVPERKSFPPRLLITLLGGISDLLICIAWIFCRRRWADANPEGPGKVLAQEVLADLRDGFRVGSTNGANSVYHDSPKSSD